MKPFFRFALLCSFLHFMPLARAQNVDFNYLTHKKPEQISKYFPGADNTVTIPVAFGDSALQTPEKLKELKGLQIVKIELVYSDFQSTASFDQPSLNGARLRMLKKAAPYLFNMSTIEWSMLAQTACKNEEQARSYFHGFVIHFKPEPDASTFSRDSSLFKGMLNSDSLGHYINILVVTRHIKKSKTLTGRYLPISDKKRRAGITYSHKGIWGRYPEYDRESDTLKAESWLPVYVENPDAAGYIVRHFTDTVVNATFRRNMKNWDSVLIVQDVTGSMGPYTTQVMLWNRLNFSHSPSHDFLFFNDGDNKPDRDKVIGKTGGLYYVHAHHIEEVEAKCDTAMRKGNGGDCAENNIEALLAAQKHLKGKKQLVMIADNNAPVKDIALLPYVKVPVHIILCGATGEGVNTDYLNIARATGGSIHTMEQDLSDLLRFSEGETLTLNGFRYKIQGGKFQLCGEAPASVTTAGHGDK